MTYCRYIYCLTVGVKSAFYLPFPHVQFLTDIFQVIYGNDIVIIISQFQSDSSEIQSVRIDSEIICCVFLSSCLFVFYSVHFIVSVTEVERFLRFFFL